MLVRDLLLLFVDCVYMLFIFTSNDSSQADNFIYFYKGT